MKKTIKTENYEWMLEVEPELYSDKPCKYQVNRKEYGLYSKRDASVICEFLRRAGIKIINEGIEE